MFCLIFSPFKFKCYKVLYSTWEGQEKEVVAGKNSAMKLARGRKKYNSEWQKAGSKEREKQ